MAWISIGPALKLLRLSALLLAGQTALADSPPFEFLYIEANEGTASGGHVAARLGDEVFHYQHVEPGLLRLFRDDWSWFTLHYGTHENRNIHAQPVELDTETQQRLYDELEHRRLLQDEQFAALQGLRQQRALLQALRARQQGEKTVLSVAGAGLFNDKPGDRQEPALVSLGEEIKALAGNRLAQKTAELTRELEHPSSVLSVPETSEFSSLKYHPNDYTAAQHYADLLLLRRALETLEAAYPLQSSGILEPAPAEFIITSRQKQALENYRQKLYRELRRLALDPQPEKALALIAGMAQLAAISRSLDSGKLLFLNTKETAAPLQTNAPQIEHGPALQTLFAQAREQWQRQKSLIDSNEELNELNYRSLEKAANVLMYFRDALQSPGAAQMMRLQTIPQTDADIALPPNNLEIARLDTAIVELEQRSNRLTTRMHALYGYNLIGRNCVTELVSRLNEILPPHTTAAVSQSVLQAFSFIPFVGYELMQINADANRSYLIPSHRNRLLARSKTLEDPSWVALRESNTVSAMLYPNQTQTPSFLFFTEDAVWPRPLQGSLNAATGLAQAASGVFSLPWDNGKRLKLGAGAILVSLPELLFFNIRKGSYPEWTRPAP